MKTVFLGLFEVCGQYSALESGFKENGWNTIRVDLTDNHFAYRQTQDGGILFRLWELFWRLKSKEPRISLNKIIYKLICESLAFLCVVSICLRCDAVIFGYATKFFKGNWEFYLYKLFKVKTIFIFHGTDARPPYLSAKYRDISDSSLCEMASISLTNIQKIESHADYLVSSPTISQFFAKPYIHSHALGMMFDSEEMISVTKSKSENKFVRKIPRVVHCPSDPKIKGSVEIRAAVAKLKSEGVKFEYIEILNVAHKEVLEKLRDADLLIDCMNSDGPIGNIGMEAGFFSVPSLVSGNASDIFSMMPVKKHLPPSIYVEPENFYDELKRLINDHEYRQIAGDRIRTYIDTYISNAKIAKRYEQLITDDADEDWYLVPAMFSYCHGSLPYGEGIENMCRLSNKYSFESLQLDERFQTHIDNV